MTIDSSAPELHHFLGSENIASAQRLNTSESSKSDPKDFSHMGSHSLPRLVGQRLLTTKDCRVTRDALGTQKTLTGTGFYALLFLVCGQ